MNDERPISTTARDELGNDRQSHPVSRLRYGFLSLVIVWSPLPLLILDLASLNRKIREKYILIKLQKEHNFCCHVNVSFFYFWYIRQELDIIDI